MQSTPSEGLRFLATVALGAVAAGLLVLMRVETSSPVAWAAQVVIAGAAGTIIEWRQSRARGFRPSYAVGISVAVLLLLVIALCALALGYRYVDPPLYERTMLQVFEGATPSEVNGGFARCLLWSVLTFATVSLLALRFFQRASHVHRDMTHIADIVNGSDLFDRARRAGRNPPQDLIDEYHSTLDGLLQRVWGCLGRKVTFLPSRRRITVWIMQPILKDAGRIDEASTVPELAERIRGAGARWNWAPVLKGFIPLHCWSRDSIFTDLRESFRLSPYSSTVGDRIGRGAGVAASDDASERRRKLRKYLGKSDTVHVLRKEFAGKTSVVGYIFHSDHERRRTWLRDDVLADQVLSNTKPSSPAHAVFPPFRSYVGVPIHYRGHRVAVLMVTACWPAALTEYHRLVLGAARHLLGTWLGLGARHKLLRHVTDDPNLHALVLDTFGRNRENLDMEAIP